MAEITIEVNPGTANYKKLEYYKKIGINRLSIGLQSTNDKILKTIGRIHTFSEFESVYEMARNIGFGNINVDLMIGLPTQTIEDVEDSLDKIIKKSPEHISVYSLILEDDTKLKDLVESQKLNLPDEDEERAMYWKVKNTLEGCGYKHYEISNFAKPGYHSKHNTDCWKQKEYLGFGLAAHSYYNNVRFSNITDIDAYIGDIFNNSMEKNRQIEERQTVEDKIREHIILQLRMIDGLDVERFRKLFSVNVRERFKEELEKLMKEDFIIVDDRSVRLTDKGIDFANVVWGEFV